jgi:hypothetical protein
MDLKKITHDMRNDIQVILFALCEESEEECRIAARKAVGSLLSKLKEVESHAPK